MKKSVFFLLVLLFPVGMAAGQADGLRGFLKAKDRKLLRAQSERMFETLRPLLAKAAASTLELWAGRTWLGQGTVVGKEKVLAKWSETRARTREGRVLCQTAEGKTLWAEVTGTYPEHDLAVLKVPGLKAPPVVWAQGNSPRLGTFLALARPNGDPVAMGVVSVRPRSFMGIYAREAEGGGIIVWQVEPRSAAHKAGLRPGDRLVRLDGKKLGSHAELVRTLKNLEVGEKVLVAYERKGRQGEATVLLDERPPEVRSPTRRGQVMRRMGTRISAVGEGFRSAMQSDMQIDPRDCGAPAVNLDGEAVGIAIARTSRIRTSIIPARTILALLEQEPRPVPIARGGAVRPDSEEAEERAELPRDFLRDFFGE